jgi:putative membrane protein
MTAPDRPRATVAGRACVERAVTSTTWWLLAAVIGTEILYPLVDGAVRARLVVVTVVLGFAASVWHAAATRGTRVAAALVAVTAGGGFAVEALGVATGFPFGGYAYTGALGPRLAGVPVIIPLAWTWMAWPAWLAAARLTRRRSPLRRGPRERTGDLRRPAARVARVALAAVGLAAWDLFLDPQMVVEGYWRWDDPTPALPGVPDVPVGNYLGWLAVALIMMAVLSSLDTSADRGADHTTDRPMYAMYLWTYASSVMAHAVFLGLPAAAVWGGLGMGLVAVPLAVALAKEAGARVRSRGGMRG